MKPTHSLTWKLTSKQWSTVSAAVHSERQKHKDCSGLSRLTRTGDDYKLEADGATAEVFIAAVKKILQPVVNEFTLEGLFAAMGFGFPSR